jgi:hypothetical protein
MFLVYKFAHISLSKKYYFYEFYWLSNALNNSFLIYKYIILSYPEPSTACLAVDLLLCSTYCFIINSIDIRREGVPNSGVTGKNLGVGALYIIYLILSKPLHPSHWLNYIYLNPTKNCQGTSASLDLPPPPFTITSLVPNTYTLILQL